jgi:hypothetical protein
MWRCDWSLGAIFDHDLCPAQCHSSMHALACAQVGIWAFLHARQKAGDQFYMDSDATDLIEDLELLFPTLKLLNTQAEHDAAGGRSRRDADAP